MMRSHCVAMIPARIGSTRLKQKNLALIHGLPMMTYAIRSALQSGVFDRIVVNGDDPVFEKIAMDEGAEYYQRPLSLGGNHTTSDEVVYDFLSHHDTCILAWVNTTSPLQTADDIRSALSAMESRRLDSLITTEMRQVHARFLGQSLNYDATKPFARTQDIDAVELFIYSVMAWRREIFMREFRSTGSALMCGRFGTHAVSREAGLIVKTEQDLRLVTAMLSGRSDDGIQLRHQPLCEETV